MGQNVCDEKAGHLDDHRSSGTDVGNVHHPEVRDGDRHHDQTDLMDRDCVMLDGACDCIRLPGNSFPECKKYS